MKVTEHLARADRPLISFEIIPPLRGGNVRDLLALIDQGVDRQEAYDIVQTQAKRVWRGEGDLRSLLAAEPRVRETLSDEDLEALFDVDYHLRNIEVPFARLGLG